MPELVPESVDGQKTYYTPIIGRINSHSKHVQTQYSITGVDGWWDFKIAQGLQGQMPEVGKFYKLELTTKPKGQDAREGAQYMDVSRCRLAKEDEIPTETPYDSPMPPPVDSQSQPRPTRPDGEEIFRSKEELRWTEACHIASNISDIVLGDAFLDRANWIYQILVTGPDPIKDEAESLPLSGATGYSKPPWSESLVYEPLTDVPPRKPEMEF